MSIRELSPVVQTLTEEDKRRLRDWLEKELSMSAVNAEALLPQGTYLWQSPEPSYKAAEKLMQFLTDERTKRTAP